MKHAIMQASIVFGLLILLATANANALVTQFSTQNSGSDILLYYTTVDTGLDALGIRGQSHILRDSEGYLYVLYFKGAILYGKTSRDGYTTATLLVGGAGVITSNRAERSTGLSAYMDSFDKLHLAWTDYTYNTARYSKCTDLTQWNSASYWFKANEQTNGYDQVGVDGIIGGMDVIADSIGKVYLIYPYGTTVKVFEHLGAGVGKNWNAGTTTTVGAGGTKSQVSIAINDTDYLHIAVMESTAGTIYDSVWYNNANVTRNTTHWNSWTGTMIISPEADTTVTQAYNAPSITIQGSKIFVAALIKQSSSSATLRCAYSADNGTTWQHSGGHPGLTVESWSGITIITMSEVTVMREGSGNHFYVLYQDMADGIWKYKAYDTTTHTVGTASTLQFTGASAGNDMMSAERNTPNDANQGYYLFYDATPTNLNVNDATHGVPIQPPTPPLTFYTIGFNCDPTDGGTILLNETEYDDGDFDNFLPGEYNISALPALGYSFDYWEVADGVTIDEENGTANVTDDGTITAHFSLNVPEVTSTYPMDEDTDIAINTQIEITFNYSMNQSLTEGAISSDPSITGVFSWDLDNLTVTWTPSTDLDPLTLYNITVSPDAESEEGVPMADYYNFSFTTGLTPDVTPPTVESTSPEDGDTGVSSTSHVVITFSEAMNTTATNLAISISPGSITLKQWSVGNTVVTLTVTMSKGKTYEVTITTGAEDMAGNPMEAEYTFSFTTSSAGTGGNGGGGGGGGGGTTQVLGYSVPNSYLIMAGLLLLIVVLVFVVRRR